MPGSATSVFSETEDFEAALRAEGCLGLLVTGRGEFRARLTQVSLHRLRLSATDEQLPCIAVVAVPGDTILVSLPRDQGSVAICGGIRIRAGEIMTLGAGQRSFTRTDGPCRWASISLPASELVRYGSALTGAAFAIPSAVHLWRPRPATGRHLRHLHSAAIRLVERGSNALIDKEAAHGLEQQLIEALVECLSTGSAIDIPPAMRERQDVALRFEALLQAQPERPVRMAEICAALGVSTQTLRLSCEEQLGIGPAEYARRRRMQLVHRALRRKNPDMATISAVARHYGFRSLGHFAADYHALYGELPIATLRRDSGHGIPRLNLRNIRPRA